jgi:hypothetical protein
MTMNINRLALVAGAATLPAIAIPAVAAAPDPIYAAIEKHRAIRAEYERAGAEFDKVAALRSRSKVVALPRCDPEYVRLAIINDEALDRYCEATVELAETQPTTLEGITAALTYRADDHGDLNAERYETLVRAACAIAGLPEPPDECFD